MASSTAPARVLPWVSFTIYGFVLAAGLYYVLAGLGPFSPLRTLGFVAGLSALVALELFEERLRRRRPSASTVWIALLTARLGLFVLVVALDESSLSRVLFVLVPFAAYLTFGRTAGLVLGALSLLLLVLGHVLWVPHWYRDANYVADILMFGIGLAMAIAMAGVAVRERRAAARLADLSAAAERTRLARDIHDGLAHHLTAISVQLEKASAFRERDPAAADQALADARRAARRALDDVRASVGALRTAHPPRTLTAAITELVHTAGDEVSLVVSGDEPATDAATITTLHRATQEAVTNARRHGHATRVTVSITFGATGIHLAVTDDGRGFDPATPTPGFGLLGIRERVALTGGTLGLDSHPGAGTRLTVTVPHRRPAVLGT